MTVVFLDIRNTELKKLGNWVKINTVTVTYLILKKLPLQN